MWGWALYINLEGTPKMVALYQEYLDCARGAQAYAHKVPPQENRNYQPWLRLQVGASQLPQSPCHTSSHRQVAPPPEGTATP